MFHAGASSMFAAMLLWTPGCDNSASQGDSATTAAGSPTTATPTAALKGEDVTATGPLLRFDNKVHDFGSIWDIEEKTHMFTFTNTGDATLKIDEDLKTSCGCTAAKPDRFVFEPGESGSIGITFKPKGFGSQAKTITVKSNAVNEPSVTLEIRSDIKQFVTVEPHILRFHNVLKGQAHTQIVRVSSVDPDFEIINVQPRHQNMRARLIDSTAGPVQRRAIGSSEPRLIEVTLDENAPWGRVFGAVNVMTTGRLSPDAEPFEHLVTITVNAVVFGEVIVDPPFIQVGLVQPGDSFSKVCKLISRSDQPFRITSVELLGSTVPGMFVDAVPLTEPGTTGHAIVIAAAPGGYSGSIAGTIRVTTDIPGEETLSIQVAGVIRDSAETN